MTWRDDYRPASFRDVPFHVRSLDTRQGRHVDEQEFPGRDDPGSAVHVEPLGVGPRRYKIEAYVFGDDVFERRNALEAALLRQGSGLLVHPTRGEVTVAVVGDIQTTEDPTKQGGYARIAFTVVETFTARLARTPDTAAVVERDLDAFLDELASDFDEQLEPVPDGFEKSATDTLESAKGGLGAVYAAIGSGIGEVADFATDIASRIDEVGDLFTAPLGAARSWIEAVTMVASLPLRAVSTAEGVALEAGGLVDALMGAMRPLLSFGEELAPVPTPTSTRRREAANRNAVVQLIRGAALGATARALARLPFGSRTQAVAVRRELVEAWLRLEDEGSAGGNTSSGARLHQALSDARRATIEHLSEVARSLPDVFEFSVPRPLPALVIAHLLHGDARREAELLARNRIPRPYLVPAGTRLEVLADD